MELIVISFMERRRDSLRARLVRSLMTGRDSLDQGIQLVCLIEARVDGIYQK
jgi:hypothetical protein